MPARARAGSGFADGPQQSRHRARGPGPLGASRG
jgi:hypothetical protein